MTKWLSAILALLVLLLAFQPVCACGNVEAPLQDPAAQCCGDEGCGNASSEEQDPSGNEHEQGCKACNPFQSCACCACCVAPSLVALSIPWRPAEGPALQCSSPAIHADDAPAADFWQPPRAA